MPQCGKGIPAREPEGIRRLQECDGIADSDPPAVGHRAVERHPAAFSIGAGMVCVEQ